MPPRGSAGAVLAAASGLFVLTGLLAPLPSRAAEVAPDGSLVHRIPIEIPPGTRGAAPSLALAYSSKAGDGWAGKGWRLDGLPVIQRMPFGSAFGFDGKDTYAGPAGRLVDVSGNRTEFRSADESWGKYVPAYGGCSTPAGEPCSWTLSTRDGGKWLFGTTEDSRIQAVGRGGAVRVWALRRVEDDHGNAWEVDYDEDAAGGDYYPLRITYTLGHGLTTFKTVEFTWEARPDRGPLFDQGAKVDQDKRLKEITVKAGAQLVRRYRLDYLPSGPVPVSLLDKVQETGSDGVTALPPQSFVWQESNTGFAPATLWYDSAGQNDSRNKSEHWANLGSAWVAFRRLLDVNGDGRLDHVDSWGRSPSYSGYGLWVGLNTGQGFAPETVWSGNRNLNDGVNVPEYQLGNGTVRATLLDMNGDGRPDRVTSFQPDFTGGPDGIWVGLNTGQGFATATRWWTAVGDGNYPTYAGADGTYAALLDMNGDGLPDRVSPNEGTVLGTWVALNTGSGFTALTQWASATANNNSHWPEWKDAAGCTLSKLVDMNGDNRPDRVTAQNYQTNEAGLWVALNTGSGFAPAARWLTSTGTTSRNCPEWKSSDNLQLYATLQDMNGDGLPDRVTHENYDTTGAPGLWVSLNTGRGFEPKTLWYKADAGPADQNYVRSGGSSGSEVYYYTQLIDMNGDRRPDRLSHHNYVTNTPGLWVAFNTGSGFAPAVSWWTPPAGANGAAHIPRWDGYGTYASELDVNGDGFPDRAFHHNYEKNISGLWVALNNQRPVVLTTVRNGLGGMTLIEYGRPGTPGLEAALRPDLATCGGGTEGGYGKPCGIAQAAPRLLVARLTVQDGRGTDRVTRYEYGNGRIAPGGAADQVSLGFEWRKETDLQSGISETVSYRQDRPFTGRPARVERSAGNGGLLARRENAWEAVQTRPGVTEVRRMRESAAAFEMGAPVSTSTRSTAWDAWGFPVRASECAEADCTVTETVYTHDATAWRLGRIDEVKTSGWGNILDWERRTWTGRDLTRRERFLCPRSDECRSEADGRWVAVEQGRTWDAHGNPTAWSDALGRATALAWDPVWRAFVASSTDARGWVTTKTWDPSGRLLTETDPNGATWTTVWDSLGRRARATAPDGQVLTYRYESWGDPRAQAEVEEMTDDGQTTWTKRLFDGLRQVYRTESSGDAGQVVVVDNEAGVAGGVRYARISRPRYAAEPPVWSTTEDDPAGRKSKVTFFDGSVTRYAYGPGTASRITASGTTAEAFDARGRLVHRTDVTGQTGQFRYDLLGRPTGTTLPGGQTLRLSYDSWGRRTALDDPALGRLAWAYDDVGNVVRSIDALGRTSTFTYDALSRLVRKEVPGMAPAVFTWDGAVPYGKGRLTRIEDGSGTTAFAYDAAGRMTERSVTFAGLAEPFVQRLAYDAAGRPSVLTWPDGSLQEQRYTAGGNLAEVRLSNATADGVSGNLLYALFSRYTAAGLPGRKELVTGVTTDYSYLQDRLHRLVTVDPAGAELQDLTYGYDTFGNIASITDGRPSTLVSGVETSETQGFTYDPANRLLAATGAYGTRRFAYDAPGNLTTLGGRIERTLTYDGPRAVSGTGFAATWDAAGNLATKTLDGVQWAYAYDGENRLVEVRKDGQPWVDLAYNYAGERVKKVFHRPGGGTLTTYYVGRGYEARQASDETTHRVTRHLYARSLGKVATVTRDVPGVVGEPVPEAGLVGDTLAGGPVGTWFYHPTQVGSAAVVSDGAGREATRILYFPYGEMDLDHSAGLDSVTFKYTGQELDEETGLLYYRARYYDPAIGRFLSADPVVPGGGSRTLGFNRYTYLEGNPIFYSDPSGHGPSCGSWLSCTLQGAQKELQKALHNAQEELDRAAELARQERDRVEEQLKKEREAAAAELQREMRNAAELARRAAEAQIALVQSSFANALDPMRISDTTVHQFQDGASAARAVLQNTAGRLAEGLADRGLISHRDVPATAAVLEEAGYQAIGSFSKAAEMAIRYTPPPREVRPGDWTPVVSSEGARGQAPYLPTWDSHPPQNARPWGDLPIDLATGCVPGSGEC